MNTYLNRLKHYITNVSIFRRRYFIYKEVGKELFYVKTTRLFTRTYFIDYRLLKETKLIAVQKFCGHKSLIDAQETINRHIKTVKKVYLRLNKVYEE